MKNDTSTLLYYKVIIDNEPRALYVTSNGKIELASAAITKTPTTAQKAKRDWNQIPYVDEKGNGVTGVFYLNSAFKPTSYFSLSGTTPVLSDKMDTPLYFDVLSVDSCLIESYDKSTKSGTGSCLSAIKNGNDDILEMEAMITDPKKGVKKQTWIFVQELVED